VPDVEIASLDQTALVGKDHDLSAVAGWAGHARHEPSQQRYRRRQRGHRRRECGRDL